MGNQAPRDPNRVPSVLLDDSIASTAIPATGLALSGVEALAVAIVDASGNQITAFGGSGGTVAISGTVPVSGTVTSTAGNSTGGTLDLLKNGTVTISGTVPISGTVTTSMGNLTGGTLNAVQNAGTIQNMLAGTVSTILNAGTVQNQLGGTITKLLGGTIDTLSSITNIAGGTIAISGTVPISGTVTATAGNASGGTLDLVKTVGTINNIAGGTVAISGTPNINIAASGLTALTTATGVRDANTLRVTVATNDLVPVTGTLAISGTVPVSGTVMEDGRTNRDILTFGTTFGGTAAGYGTLVGSASVGAGTHIWMNDVSIVNTVGTITAMVGFGTALSGASVIARGQFAPNGGIQKSFPKAVNGGTPNMDLVCYISGAGTVDFNVSYFISA